MELTQIINNIYYTATPTNVGVVKDRRTAILIDSGLDDDAAKRILRMLGSKNLRLKAIINTHAHADHCGGNNYLKDTTGAVVFAPEIEAGIIQYPYLEPVYLFSGACPIEELRNKFLMAKPSPVDHVISRGQGRLSFDEVELEVVQLPGHSFNQIGIKVEGVLFCADSVFSHSILSRHKIPFCVDIGKQKETLAFLRESDCRFYVPSHAEPGNNISDVVAMNSQIIESVEACVLGILDSPKITEQILKEVCSLYGIEVRGAQQYYLMKTVTMAYLSWLYGRGILGFQVQDNSLRWEKK